MRHAVDRVAHLAYVPGFATGAPKDSTRFMLLFQFLLVVHFVIALALVTVVLMQRSEGGGLGMGGSPGGLMSARGAADFLTRATSILGGLFIALSILLAVLAAQGRVAKVVAPTTPPPAAATAPIQAPAQTDPSVPFASGARSALAPTGNTAARADNGTVPLAQ
ncbi:preprotein translocase, SecG subunit [compost metagenome]|jgi:preprotein translocase subunit SecG